MCSNGYNSFPLAQLEEVCFSLVRLQDHGHGHDVLYDRTVLFDKQNNDSSERLTLDRCRGGLFNSESHQTETGQVKGRKDASFTKAVLSSHCNVMSYVRPQSEVSVGQQNTPYGFSEAHYPPPGPNIAEKIIALKKDDQRSCRFCYSLQSFVVLVLH